jgi:hypothetical protein
MTECSDVVAADPADEELAREEVREQRACTSGASRSNSLSST